MDDSIMKPTFSDVKKDILENDFIRGRFGVHGTYSPNWDTIKMQLTEIKHKQVIGNGDILFTIHGVEFSTEDIEVMNNNIVPVFVIQNEQYIFEFVLSKIFVSETDFDLLNSQLDNSQ